MNQITLQNPETPLFLQEPLRSITKAEQVVELLGSDTVKLTVESAEPVRFYIGQTLLVFGREYTLNQLPNEEKKGNRHFEYNLTLEGPQYQLRSARYFNQDVLGFGLTSDFPLTGDAELFLDVLINNLARVFGSGVWLKGEFPTSETFTIQFQAHNCLSALQEICKTVGTEFDIVKGGSSYTIHLRPQGQALPDTYEFGRTGGLFNLKRLTVDENDIVTRLYAFGSTKNISPTYRDRSPRLRLPDPGYIEDVEAINKFGLIEGEYTFEEEYPRHDGVVTAVGSLTTFQDASMSFDLFAKTGSDYTYLTPGNPAKVHFNSGNLAGYQFEVMDYVHATKTFTLKPYKDQQGMDMPNPDSVAFQFTSGDKYVILDITLPSSYVEIAENRLLAKAQARLDKVKHPKVQYQLTFDEMYLKEMAGGGSIVNYFSTGDYVNIRDTAMLIDDASRIIALRRDVLRPYRYILTIDETYKVSVFNEIEREIKDLERIVKTFGMTDPNRARMGWLTTLELLGMVFDTDGYFDGGKIRPESIETMMLVVGAKSQQFILQDVVLEPNFEGQPNVVTVSAGKLIHYAIKEDIVIWDIAASTHTIPDNNARYIYAKVHKTNLSDGQIIFSTEQIKADEDGTYYHLLVGTLHRVIDGVRWISLTYGATAINGRFIKTGRIQSFDGRTWFDLDLGAIGGYIKFIDSNGNYRDLSDIGAATDRFYEVTVIEPPVHYVDGKVEAWFATVDPGTWPGGEESLHEGDMWYNPNTDSVRRREGGAWVPVVDAATLSAYRKQYTIRGNNAHVNLFTAQPLAPYADNDLWMSPEGLRRSVKEKLPGHPFDINDWVEPFNFDNTATAIDGHIVTSGIIQLAGDKNAIWAGMSGQGTDDDSVRFWAGASTVNRDTAPLRIFQGGWLVARSRIEVEGWNPLTEEYEGQAGLAGWAGPGVEDDGIRGWAGATYENRANAPFRYTREGFVWAEKGQFGNMQIRGGGLVNRDADNNVTGEAIIALHRENNEGSFIAGTNVLPGLMGGTNGLLRVSNTKVGDDDNYAAIFDASGSNGGHNYALYTGAGVAQFRTALVNGRRSITVAPLAGQTVEFDPSQVDFISLIYTDGAAPGVKMKATGLMHPITAGKMVTIESRNDVRQFWIMDTLKGGDRQFQGGTVVTIVYNGAEWKVAGGYDNDW